MTPTPEWQTDGEFDIYKLLEPICARPKMYFGEEAISILYWFLTGYEWALQNNSVPYRKVGPFDWRFYFFVKKSCGAKDDKTHWAGMILNFCDNDEAKALAKFSELLQEFRQQEQK